MVKFYGETEYEDKNNISYEEKIYQLRNLEEKLKKYIMTYDDKYEDIYYDMRDQFLSLSISKNPNFDMDKWIDINRMRKMIICS